MRTILKLCVFITLLSAASFAQCGAAGQVVPNPFGAIPGRLCTGALPSGTNNNGAVYWTTTGPASTPAGGAGTLCLVSTNGGVPVFSSCAGSTSTSWSALSAPSGNTSLSMVANLTTLTWGATTGAGANFFTITDTPNNTGTGTALFINLASGSAAKPFEAAVNGNGVIVNNGGVLTPIGTGAVNATQVNGTAVNNNFTVVASNAQGQLVQANVTGSGNVVLSASPTLSGTLTVSALTTNSTVTFAQLAGAGSRCLHVDLNGQLSATGSDCGAGGGGGSSALSAITAASGANTIANGDNAQIWNWAPTTASRIAFTFGETTAATSSGTPILVDIQTLSTSTANPFQVTAGGTANGIRVSTAGVLAAIGTGHVNADQVNGAVLPTSSMVKTNGSNQLITAVSGTDFAPATSGSVPLAGNGSGGFQNASQAMVAALWTGTNCNTNTNIPILNGNCAIPGGQAGALTALGNISTPPTFTATSNTNNIWSATLTGNIASATFSGGSAGQVLAFMLCQDGVGGRTFVGPAGFSLLSAPSPVASVCTRQLGFWDGSAFQPLGPAMADGGSTVLKEGAMPGSNPPSGYEFEVADSTQHTPQTKDSSGNLNTQVRTAGSATSNQWVDYIATTGIPHTSQPALSNISGTIALAQTQLTTNGDLWTVAGGVLARLGVGANGNCLVVTTGAPAWGSCSGSAAALSAIIAAAGANTINNGDNAQVWNWQLTTASKSAFTFGENTAGTSSGTPILVNIQTLATSTVNPLQVTALGTANGIRVNTSGVLAAIGTGHVNADQLNGSSATGANGNLASWGASNVLGDSSIAAANLVTAASAAGAANQVCVSSGASKTCTYIDHPEVLVIPAANCNNATGGAGWNIPASNAPTIACRAGTNNLDGALQWANNNTTTNAQFEVEIPGDWDSGTQPYINIFYGSGANTSGTVKWTFSSACTKADGSVSDDPSFVAESTTSGKTMAVANRMWAESVQFTAITSGNNCVAGGVAFIKITSGNGTATSTVNVYKVTMTIPRKIVVQAN